MDSVTNLAGNWIVPPYGEAHNHHVESSDRLDDLIQRYIESGVYYVKNPNVLPMAVTDIREKVNKPTSIDVSFAFGGFTGPGGHPSSVVERNIRWGIWTEADGEGAFYYEPEFELRKNAVTKVIPDLIRSSFPREAKSPCPYKVRRFRLRGRNDGSKFLKSNSGYEIANKQDLDRKWPDFMNNNPDFVKAYLLYSEEFEARAGDDQFTGWRGLNPDLLQELTRRAHASGLRISVHVETARDFRYAIEGGVD